MTAKTKKYPPTAEWRQFSALATKAGRKYYWVATQVGMAYGTLYNTFNGYPGYSGFSDEQKAEIARLVDAEVSDIWPEPAPAVAPDGQS